MRSMVTPKSLLAPIGPNPRAIADDVWAKLMWAGLNLTVDGRASVVILTPLAA
jgi:hypothetical protein